MKIINGNVVLFDVANPAWDEQATKAKASGVAFAEAVAPYAPRAAFVDRDAELCRTQRAQAAAGFVWATICSNIYGFCVRDTMNDGRGRMSPNFKTPVEAMLWAKDWHSADPTRRRVSMSKPRVESYYTDAMRAESAALEEAMLFILAVEAGATPLSCIRCRGRQDFPTFLAGAPLCYACGDRVK